MQTIRAYAEDQNIKILAYWPSVDINTNEVRTVYSVPLTIYTGVNNPIKILCLNSDQKNANVSAVNVQVGLFEANTENELIVANAVPIDAANGVVQITFTASQLAPLDFGLYQVAMTAIGANSVATPLYIDDNYQTRLPIRLSKGPVLAYASPINVVFTDQLDIGVVSQQIDLTNRPMGSTLSTLQIGFTGYTGNLLAQASTITNPLVPSDWGNVTSNNFSNFSGNIFQNVPGSYAEMRFILDGIDPNGWGNVPSSNIANVVAFANVRI